MGFVEHLVELIAPTRCAGCDMPGSLLCPECVARIGALEPSHSCPRCATPNGALVCTECWNTSFSFELAVAAGELARPLSRAVVLHKDAGERRLARTLGALVAGRIASSWPGWCDVVSWVPATPAARSRRGFDHAEALAESAAALLSVPSESLLVRSAARDQRSLGRLARAANANSSFAIDRPPAGRRVVLVDDVLTTGATLDAAAGMLLEAGAETVRVAVVARAW